MEPSDKKRKNSIGRAKYCYVSLFGLSSLKSLKQAIFENTVKKDTADKPNDFSALIDKYNSAGDTLGRIYRKFLKIAADVSSPITRGLPTTIESIQFASIRDTLICIDDFERKSSGLTDKEVLGLISYLIEARDCSVLLILNSNTIDEESDYFKYHEKVFDYEIEITPTPEESACLIFDENNYYDKKIINKLTLLNTGNIRIFKKVKYFSEALKPYLEQQPETITDKALSTLSLTIWSIYEGDENKVDIDFIKQFNNTEYILPTSDDEQSDEDKENERQAIFLHIYGFLYCDELDLALISLVEKGYADEDLIKKVIREMADQVAHSEAISTLRAAWRLYFDSFDLNDEEVFQAFETSLNTCLLKLEPIDLDGVCELYKAIDRHDSAKAHVDQFMKHIRGLPQKLDEDDIFRWPKDEYLNDSLMRYFEEADNQKTITELILERSTKDKYNTKDCLQLASKEVDEFYTLFKSINSENLIRHVDYCMSFGEIRTPGNEDSQKSFEQIFCKAYEAILRIRKESIMNRARTDRYMKYQKRYDFLMNPPAKEL